MKLRAKRGLARVSIQDQDQKVPETSNLPLYYLPPLKRLFALSPDLDELCRDCRKFDRGAWKKTVIRARYVLKTEEERLGLINRGVGLFLQSRGGQRELIIEENLKRQRQANDDRKAVRKTVSMQITLCALYRLFLFGTDFSPFNLSDEEKSLLTSYFENSTGHEPPPQPAGSGKYESTASTPAIVTLDAALRSLESGLAEPDVIAVQGALEIASSEILRRIGRLSVDFDSRLRHEPTGEGKENRENEYRIRVALVLESERAELVGKAITGLLRCLGGQQRLRMEFASRRSQEREMIKDPRIEQIIERLSEAKKQ